MQVRALFLPLMNTSEDLTIPLEWYEKTAHLREGVNIYHMLPTPSEVTGGWMTAVEDLPDICWMYWSELTESWRPCTTCFEAAWRFLRGEKIELIDPFPSNIMGVWGGWVLTGVMDPVKVYESLRQKK